MEVKLKWMSRNHAKEMVQWFSECSLWTSSVSIIWKLLEMQILEHNPRHTKIETLRVWKSHLCALGEI